MERLGGHGARRENGMFHINQRTNRIAQHRARIGKHVPAMVTACMLWAIK